MNRVLTIQVEIVDKDESRWIWNSHMHNRPAFGVHVHGIHEGPMPREINDITHWGPMRKEEE